METNAKNRILNIETLAGRAARLRLEMHQHIGMSIQQAGMLQGAFHHELERAVMAERERLAKLYGADPSGKWKGKEIATDLRRYNTDPSWRIA